MLQLIKDTYESIKKFIVPGGIVAALANLFLGQIFTAVVIGLTTYYYWKNEYGIQKLIAKI